MLQYIQLLRNIGTLRKHYRELDLGSTKATAKVAELLFRKASNALPPPSSG